MLRMMQSDYILTFFLFDTVINVFYLFFEQFCISVMLASTLALLR